MRRCDLSETAPSSRAPRRPEDAEALAAAVAALAQMGVVSLRAEWRRLYQTHPPKKLSRDSLQLAVAWKLQARALGGLSARAKRRLSELADVLASRSDLPKARRASLKPGARLVRHWGGQTHEVVVTESGFVWRERTWKSLSVIAREMTGTRWSGPRFFGLDRAGNAERGGATGGRAIVAT
jgi:hypothetical protein